MARKLAEATKAARARRTRGETGLRRFFAAAFWAVVFRAPVLEALAFFWPGGIVDVLWADDDFDGEAAAGMSGDAEGAGDVNWAPAWNDPGVNRKNVSAKTETANLRTEPYLHLKVGTHNA